MKFKYGIYSKSEFVWVLENLESAGISLWHFPMLENPRNKLMVLERFGNLLNSSNNKKVIADSKENN